ncbi:MAG: LacI family DNA-binding transcriptional regulator [Ndongobacter sp.]|nr:LacI family DNA-binding transcriptional regulator [Ndongobacter sp.]
MTIKDVAEYSGVSVSTVSRVLNNHPDVSDAVRLRVMKAVKKLHYVPNSSARDLVRTQTDTVGLVVRGIGNPFFSAVMQSVEQSVMRAGYTLVTHQIGSKDDELAAAASLARSKKLRGLILLGGCFDYSPEQVETLSIPFVCCSYTNTFGSLAKEAYSSVSIDDQKEAFRAVRYLTERGHRKIAVLLNSKDDRSISELRYRGYVEALREAGIELDEGLVEETGTFAMKDAYEGACRLIQRRQDFTALFVIADSMAIAAMKALHDAQRAVPEDCSVIAIDGISASLYTVPTLTTLIQPAERMGESSVAILLDMLNGQGANRQIQLDTALQIGQSVRRCDEGSR